MSHGPTYTHTQPGALNAARLLADATQREADTREGRAMCHTIAAGVRDILTGNDPDPTAPFDAVLADLAWHPRHDVAHLTGTYWTATGTRGQLDPDAVDELNEWTEYLGWANAHVWKPLCELIEDDGDIAVYRMDLVKAAHSPLGVLELPADLGQIRDAYDRLNATLPRPWHTRETLYDEAGGTDAEEGETDYVGVEIVAANGMRVAELGASMGPEDVEDGHERRSVLTGVRADAALVAGAPQDLAYLLNLLAQAQDLMARTHH